MKTSLLLTLLSLFIALPVSATYEEELEKAKVSLPLRNEAYTQQEIMDKLSPHLSPAIKPLYESSLTLMFAQFGAPKHPVATITGGWQCLLAKVTDAENRHMNGKKNDLNNVELGVIDIFSEDVPLIFKFQVNMASEILKLEIDSLEKDQLIALLDLLALHKKSLASRFPSLLALVNEHAPCAACVKSAKHGYGVQDVQTDAAAAAQQTPQTTPSVQPKTSTSSTGILTSVLGAIGRAGDVMMTVFRHDSDRYVGTGNF